MHTAHLLHMLITEYHQGHINSQIAMSYLTGRYPGLPKSAVASYLAIFEKFHVSPTGW
jgi:hypothetical protein